MQNTVFSANDKFLEQKGVIAIIINSKEINDYSQTKFLNYKAIDYLKDAFLGMKVKDVFIKKQSSLNELLTPSVLKYDYIFLINANLPLLTSKTVMESLEYFINTKAAICKLPSGYIINSVEHQKLRKNESVEATPNFFCEEDFFEYKNINSYSKMFEILKSRIILKHIKNGVNIIDVQNVYIEKTVNIASGAIIHPFCYLSGNVFVAPGQVIAPFSKICEK